MKPTPHTCSIQLKQLLDAYLAHLSVRAYAPGTIRNTALYLANMLAWLDSNKVITPGDITRAMIERYQQVIQAHRKRDGQPLAIAGQHVRLTTIRVFFRWLVRARHCENDPSADIELPKIGHRLPRRVLTVTEVEKIFAKTSPSTQVGLRDRAILEVFYSSGIRRSELCALHLDQIDLERGSLLIVNGKGRKDRFVPLGQRAAKWVKRYLAEARDQFQPAPNETAVFLGKNGHAITHGVLGAIVHAYVKKSAIANRGSCHLFRHAMATHMLEGGADIRYIQHILGHARLSTTEIYTQVNIAHLLAVHHQTHPAERSQLTKHKVAPGQRCPHCGCIVPPTAVDQTT